MATARKSSEPPAVFKHFTVPDIIPDEYFKAKYNYCNKEIIGSVKVTTNWWKHLVRNTFQDKLIPHV